MTLKAISGKICRSASAFRKRKKMQAETLADSHALAADAVKAIVSEMPWLSLSKYADPKCVSTPASPLFSQNFEDAVLSEIFNRIGPGSQRFLEIGASNGIQNSTRFFLEIMGWSGIWIEADPVACALARRTFSAYCESGKLRIVDGMATVENINGLIGDEKEFDLLSVDVDQNTSHIWRALDSRSRVACIEYNPFMPRHVDWEVAYEADGAWDRSKTFGASLKRLERIGGDKDMALVGCDFSGVNAYFVSKSEDLALFQAPFSAEFHYEPFRRGASSAYTKKNRT